MVYQDHLTKFVVLRPLKTKTANEVALHLMDIFTLIGAPVVLQSDNGREFCNKVIYELTQMWPKMTLVHGKPRHSQSQGSVERANQDIENMITIWMQDNNIENWAEGVKFVQFMKNNVYHSGIRTTPYEAMFGTKTKIGLKDSNLPPESYENIHTEEELETIIQFASNSESQMENQIIDSSSALNIVNSGSENKPENNQASEEITELTSIDSIINSDIIISDIPVDDLIMENKEDNTVITNESNHQPKQLICSTCEKDGDNVKLCKSCENYINLTCTVNQATDNLLCNLCMKGEDINKIRKNAKESLEQQAKRMKHISDSSHPHVGIGDTVRIPVPRGG